MTKGEAARQTLQVATRSRMTENLLIRRRQADSPAPFPPAPAIAACGLGRPAEGGRRPGRRAPAARAGRRRRAGPGVPGRVDQPRFAPAAAAAGKTSFSWLDPLPPPPRPVRGYGPFSPPIFPSSLIPYNPPFASLWRRRTGRTAARWRARSLLVRRPTPRRAAAWRATAVAAARRRQPPFRAGAAGGPETTGCGPTPYTRRQGRSRTTTARGAGRGRLRAA